jgi:hypothetical protein
MSSHFFRQLSYGITDQIHLEKIKKGHVVQLEVEQAQAESGYQGELSLLPAAQLRNNQSDPPRKKSRRVML